MYAKYKKKLLDLNILFDQKKMYCPIEGCESFIQMGLLPDEPKEHCLCGNGHEACFKCEKEWHHGKVCVKTRWRK